MPKVLVNLPSENLTTVLGNVTSPFVVISELIKNGVDAGANAVTINIDTNKSEIKIIDDGKGFTIEEIIELGIASESRKKRDTNLKSPGGEMFLGSKGLAIFSAFSLGSKVTIRTKNENNEAYVINWIKGEKEFDYYEVESSEISEGTEVLISGINFKEMLLLASEKELIKFKHISIRNFKKDLNIPKVILLKDSQYIDIDLKNIEDFSEDFTAKVSFAYNRKKNILEYQYECGDPRISKEKIFFNLSEKIDIQKCLKEHYNIIKILVNIDEYLAKNLIENDEIEIPDFEGVWYMKRDKKNKYMNDFGFGIRLYVNNFALYNYLNTNNDWLQLTNISQNKKSTNFKQHNVFGYLNFPEFNDLNEGLKISNERGGFIENVYFNKFMDVLYTFVLLTTIGIDIAQKNNLIKDKPENKTIGNGETGNGETGNGETGNGETGNGETGNGETGNGETGNDETGNGETGNGETGNGETGNGETGNGETGNSETGNSETGNSETGNGETGNGETGNGTTGGPTPGGGIPGTFFEHISWGGNLDPSNNDHIGLIVALDELHRMSSKKIREDGRMEKIYCIFPVGAGMLLRTAYEQSLILQLKKTGLWNNLKQQFTFPMLSNIETYVNQNKTTVLPDQHMRKAFSSIISIRSRDFLNSNIHNPGLIRTTSSTLEGITNGGIYSLINLIIKNI
jgi:hypothetical protein